MIFKKLLKYSSVPDTQMTWLADENKSSCEKVGQVAVNKGADEKRKAVFQRYNNSLFKHFPI